MKQAPGLLSKEEKAQVSTVESEAVNSLAAVENEFHSSVPGASERWKPRLLLLHCSWSEIAFLPLFLTQHGVWGVGSCLPHARYSIFLGPFHSFVESQWL